MATTHQFDLEVMFTDIFLSGPSLIRICFESISKIFLRPENSKFQIFSDRKKILEIAYLFLKKFINTFLYSDESEKEEKLEEKSNE